MLTKSEKMLIETTMENMIVANKNGINTRVLNNSVYNNLIGRISNLNMHHLAGMLSWVYKAYNHTFLVRKSGNSIIV